MCRPIGSLLELLAFVRAVDVPQLVNRSLKLNSCAISSALVLSPMIRLRMVPLLWFSLAASSMTLFPVLDAWFEDGRAVVKVALRLVIFGIQSKVITTITITTVDEI